MTFVSDNGKQTLQKTDSLNAQFNDVIIFAHATEYCSIHAGVEFGSGDVDD